MSDHCLLENLWHSLKNGCKVPEKVSNLYNVSQIIREKWVKITLSLFVYIYIYIYLFFYLFFIIIFLNLIIH